MNGAGLLYNAGRIILPGCENIVAHACSCDGVSNRSGRECADAQCLANRLSESRVAPVDLGHEGKASHGNMIGLPAIFGPQAGLRPRNRLLRYAFRTNENLGVAAQITAVFLIETTETNDVFC